MDNSRKCLGKNGTLIIACFLLVSITASNIAAQNLVGHWTFEAGTELQDLTGNFSNLVLQNGATITNGELDVESGQWANAIGYSGPAITEKTLLSWVYLEDLNIRSGSILTIDQTNADQFDAIVYAERQPYRWMSGSSLFSRTQDPVPGYAESTAEELVFIAISYQNVAGSPRIRIYHNGVLIGDYTQGPIATWSGANTEVIFGARHSFGTSPIGTLDGRIAEARIYDRVLSEAEINSIFNPPPIPTVSQWGLIILFLSFLIFAVAMLKERKITRAIN